MTSVAIELALAAAAVRQQADLPDANRQADRLEAATAATLREAAAAGGDLAALRREAVFRTLQDPTIWTTIRGGATP